MNEAGATTYFCADGSRVVLLYHTPEVWARRVYEQMLSIGCSPEYAGRRAGLIRAASLERPEVTGG